MKRLTITLLTLLVLGGCSQEPTEFERCIEANMPKDERQEKMDKFLEEHGWDKYNWLQIDDDPKLNDEEEERHLLYEKEVEKKLNPYEKEIKRCEDDMFGDYFSKFLESTKIDRDQMMTLEILADYNLFIEPYIEEECGYIEEGYLDKATKICHFQGIY